MERRYTDEQVKWYGRYKPIKGRVIMCGSYCFVSRKTLPVWWCGVSGLRFAPSSSV